MVEKEYKIMLNETKYAELLKESDRHGNRIHKQVNYYFDSDDLFLYKNNATLRIREKNHHYEVTLKQYLDENTELKIANEINYIIGKNDFINAIEGKVSIKDLIPHNYQLLNRAETNKLLYLGCLNTERIVFTPGGFSIKVELDKNSYLNLLDYEVECEIINDEEFVQARNYLEYMGLKIEHKVQGKYSRFVSALIKSKNNMDLEG